jgi:hypothetical protein
LRQNGVKQDSFLTILDGSIDIYTENIRAIKMSSELPGNDARRKFSSGYKKAPNLISAVADRGGLVLFTTESTK